LEAKEGSSVLIVPGFNLPIEIQNGMIVETSGKRWKIVNHKRHEAGGYIFAYELELALG
jgi:hypothetical protein